MKIESVDPQGTSSSIDPRAITSEGRGSTAGGAEDDNAHVQYGRFDNITDLPIKASADAAFGAPAQRRSLPAMVDSVVAELLA